MHSIFFFYIGPTLAKKIKYLPLKKKNCASFLKDRKTKSIFFVSTHSVEIKRIVSNLENKPSAGYDGISYTVLKNIVDEILVPLEHIFNLSLVNGVVPRKMKIAKVIPVFKKGDTSVLNNYRPISLLPSISKVLEGVFSKFQFGFREKHSTVHTILYFINKVATAIDNHKHTIGLCLDFSEAFDMVDHDILLYKLCHSEAKPLIGLEVIFKTENNM